MEQSTKEKLRYVASVVGLFAIIGLCVRGCTMAWNNRTIDKPSHKTVSFATGLSGHIEYTVYSDGSQDVKIYPGLGHRLWDSQLDQDLDGDGWVDRIRRNGAEWKANRLSELLTYEHDYEGNEGRFYKSNERLQGLMRKYPK